jgi:hypothetical protein
MPSRLVFARQGTRLTSGDDIFKKSPGSGAICVSPRLGAGHAASQVRPQRRFRMPDLRAPVAPSPLGGLACRWPPRSECPQRTASSPKTASPRRARSAVAPQILAEIAAIGCPAAFAQDGRGFRRLRSQHPAPRARPSVSPLAPRFPPPQLGWLRLLTPSTAKPRAASLPARPHPHLLCRPTRRAGMIGRPRAPLRASSATHRVDLQNFATHGRYPPRQSDDTYKLDE